MLLLAAGLASAALAPAGSADPPQPRGSISGTVTDDIGDPLQGVCVTAFGSDGAQEQNTGRSDLNGDYTIASLEPDSYVIRFGICVPLRGENFGTEFYDDEDSPEDATPVTVIGSVNTSAIDAELAPGGSISGTITDTNGRQLIGICVQAFNASGAQVGFAFLGDGDYQVDGLGAGDYRLKFSDCARFNPFTVIPEFYDNQETLAEATPVPVTAGSTTTGIAAQLEAPDRDITAPETVIDSGPEGTIRTNEASFAFSSPDTDVAKFECKLDSEPFTVCASPKTFLSLGDGPHTVSIRSVDKAGNRDETPAVRTFTVDTTVDPVYEAAISKVTVHGPRKGKRGRKATFRVKITNSGNTEATGVRLKIQGRGVRLSRAIGLIPAGATKTVKVGPKLKKRGKVKLTFKVTSANADGKSVKRGLTVK